MESRIFWGVFLGVLMASGVVAVLFALGVVGVGVAAQHQADVASQELAQSLADSAEQQRQYQAAAAARAAVESARYNLADNQRCYGGVVVQFEGTTYTQIGTIQHPIHCSGRRADSPLR